MAKIDVMSGEKSRWSNHWTGEETEGLDGSSLLLPLRTKTTVLQLIKSTTPVLSN